MLKNLKSKLLIALMLGLSFWFWLFISYAADLNSVSDVPDSWSLLTLSWFQDLRSRLINISGSWANVWIWTTNPTQKLDVNWNINASSIKVSCIWNCF